MMLFRMECRKIAGGVLYWLMVAALLAVYIFQYDPFVKGELQRTDDPNSVFYIAPDGRYAQERDDAPDVAMERAMMLGATQRLIGNYRANRYEYYPFGYVKEKALSADGQAEILRYLMELTGMDAAFLSGQTESQISDCALADDPAAGALETLPSAAPSSQTRESIGDIDISGGGAFVLEPGGGHMNAGGQFVTEGEDWQYVPNGATLEGQPTENARESQAITEQASNDPSRENQPATEIQGSIPMPSGNSLEIRVSFERFREIMEKVSGRIGRNSYFSWTMLSLYYFGNDMEDALITARQHREFYELDRVTGAFARYYCDSISLVALLLPTFVIVDLQMRDRRRGMWELVYPRSVSSAKLICVRYAAAVCMAMLPILILPAKSLLALTRYCVGVGVQADVLAIVKYILAWILPTVLLMMAVGLLLAVLMENHAAILFVGLIWLMGRPSVDKLAGGNYGLFDLIVRHNTLKGCRRMLENLRALALNRLAISALALALLGLSVIAFEWKRKGGLNFENLKSARRRGF